MKLMDVEIDCNGRGDRVEIFPLWDIHFGKANCNETALRKWIGEVVKRDRDMPDRHIRVLLGGDVCNAVSPKDIKRFDFSDVAGWLLQGETLEEIRNKLSDMPMQEVNRAAKFFEPVKHIIIGALEGNHEKTIRKRYNVDIQTALCEKLGVENLTDSVLLRLKFKRQGNFKSTITILARHGYGSGRSKSAETLKLDAMMNEWEIADVCISGHTHTFCDVAPKPVAWIPMKGAMPGKLLWRHRFALNPGCWLDSHAIGRGTYESNGCYPARAMMTSKIVIWPFYEQTAFGRGFTSPKVEVRNYPIL